VEFEAVDYYQRPLTARQLGELLKMMGVSAREILRRDEPVARQLGLARKELSEAELIELMGQHPDLIQRPIVVRGQRAVLGRPLDQVIRFLSRTSLSGCGFDPNG
jgi:arsenate reductase